MVVRVPGASSEVDAAIDAIKDNPKFRQLYFFSIQAITMCCDPQNTSYVPNAGQTLYNTEKTRALVTGLKVLKNDGDVTMGLLRVLNSMALYCKTDKDALAKFFDANAFEGTVQWIKDVDAGQFEPQALQCALETVELIQTLSPDARATGLPAAMVSKINDKMDFQMVKRLLSIAAASAESMGGAGAEGSTGTTKTLLTYLSQVRAKAAGVASADDVNEIVHLGLQVCAKQKGASIDELKMLSAVAEEFGDVPGIAEDIALVVKASIPPEDVADALEKISELEFTDPARTEAFKKFEVMAFVREYAEEVVSSAKGLTALEDEIQGLQNHDTDPAALPGACAMLAAIASTPTNRTKLNEAQIISSICDTITADSMNEADSITHLAKVLSQAALSEECASIILGGALEKIQKTVLANPGHQGLLVNFSRIVTAIARQPDLAAYLEPYNIPAMAASLTDASGPGCTAYVRALEALAPSASSAPTLKAALPHLQSMVNKHPTDPVLCKAVVDLMASAAKNVEGADALFGADDEAADLIASCLQSQGGGADIQRSAMEALEVMATDATMEKYLMQTETALKAGSKQTKIALGKTHMMAALAGTSKLRTSMQDRDVASRMLQQAETLYGGKTFDGRDELTSAVLSVVSQQTAEDSKIISRVIQFADSRAVQNEIQRDPNSRVLGDTIEAVGKMIEKSPLSEAEQIKVSTDLQGLMRNYGDNRRGVRSIAAIFSNMAKTEQGSKVILQSGAHATLLQAGRRLRVWDDVQLNVLRTVENIVNTTGEEGIKAIQDVGGIDVVRGAQGMHKNNKDLNRVINAVSAKIMPPGFLQDQYKSMLKNGRLACDRKRFDEFGQILDEIAGLTGTSEGAKVGIRNGVLGMINMAYKRVEDGEIEDEETQQRVVDAVAKIAANVTTTSSNAKAAVKANLPDTLARMVEYMLNAQDSDRYEASIIASLGAIANMAAVSPEMGGAAADRILPSLNDFIVAKANNSANFAAFSKFLAATDQSEMIFSSGFEAFRDALVTALNSDDHETAMAAGQALRVLARNRDVAAAFAESGTVKALIDSMAVGAAGGTEISERRAAQAAKALRELVQAGALNDVDDKTAIDCLDELASIARKTNNADLAAELLGPMNAILKIRPDAADSVKGFRAAILHISELTSDRPEAQKAAGQLLQAVGGDSMARDLCDEISTMTKADDFSPGKVEGKVKELAMLIASLKKPGETIEQLNDAVQSLNKVCADKRAAGKPHAGLEAARLNLFGVIGKLATEHQGTEAGDQLLALCEELAIPEICSTLKHPELSKNQTVVQAGYQAMNAISSNKNLIKMAVARFEQEELMRKMLLADPKELAGMSQGSKSAMMNLIAKFSETPEGRKALEDAAGLDAGELAAMIASPDFLGGVHSSKQLAAAANLLSGLTPAQLAQLKEEHPDLFSAAALAEMAGGDADISMQLAALQLKTALNIGEDLEMQTNQVTDSVAALREALTNRQLNDKEKMDAMKAAFEAMMAVGDDPLASLALKKGGVLELMQDIMGEDPRNVDVWDQLLPTLEEAANTPGMAATTMRVIAQALLGDADLLAEDPVLSARVVKLLNQLVATPGNGNYLANLSDFDKFTEAMKGALAGDPAALAALQELMNKAAEDVDQGSSLIKIYGVWKAEHDRAGGLTIDSPVVIENFEFVFQRCGELANEPQEPDTDNAAELQHGMLCMMLLHKDDYNSNECVAWEIETIYTSGLMTQTAPSVLKYVVDACALGVQRETIARAMSFTPTVDVALVQILQSGLETGSLTSEDLANRISILPAVTPDRQWLDNSSAMAYLCEYWARCQKGQGQYDEKVLGADLKAVRAIINKSYRDIIIDQDMAPKLTKILQNHKNYSNILLCGDAAYLLGALSFIPELKENSARAGSIQALVTFVTENLDRAKTDEPSEYAVSSAMLSLGALCLECRTNQDAFVAANGIPLDVEVLRAAAASASPQSTRPKPAFNMAHAAASVVCNTTYRRDDLKEAYGEAKAPQAVCSVISHFSNVPLETDEANRCLISMYKTVGNLSLHAKNVDTFAKNGLPQVYADFFNKNQTISDNLAIASARSLANSALDNNPSLMSGLSQTIKPFLTWLEERHTMEFEELFAPALEALAHLCRSEANVKIALDSNAIGVTRKIIKYNSGKTVLQSAIQVILTCATHKDMTEEVVKQGGLEMVSEVIQAAAQASEPSSEVATECFICVRRLCSNDKRMGEQFCADGGARNIVALMRRHVNTIMCASEGCKVICALLELFPGPDRISSSEAKERAASGGAMKMALDQKQKARGSFVEGSFEDEEVGDEGVLPLERSGDGAGPANLPSPRAWESIGLTEGKCADLIQILSANLRSETNVTSKRLVRAAVALLGYFSAERHPAFVQAFYTGTVFASMLNVVIHWKSRDASLIDNVCLVTANVAMVSPPANLETLKPPLLTLGDEVLAALKGFPKGVDAQITDVIRDTATQLNSKDSQAKDFAKLGSTKYDLTFSMHKEDKYLNGPSDLPDAIKTSLRKGGSFQVYDPKSKALRDCKWSVSQTLTKFLFTGTEGQEREIPINRISFLAVGNQSKVLQAAGYPEVKTCVISGSPSDTESVELNCVFSSKSAREQFFGPLRELREAALFVFA